MPTANFFIKPQDGWVEVASAAKFVRVSGAPHSHPYFVAAGSSAPGLTAAAATGQVLITGLPSVNETVTIGSEVYTFKAARAAAFQVTIGADATATGANLVTALAADSALVTGANVTGTVTLTARNVGTQGNVALSESATNVAVSGAALTGGAAQTVGVLCAHHPFEVNVTMTEKLYVRVPNPVANSTLNDGALRLDVFTIT